MRPYFLARYFAIFVIASMTTGCGYMAQATKDIQYDSVAVGRYRGSLMYYYASNNAPVTGKTTEDIKPCTKTFLLSQWGEPDEKTEAAEGVTVLTYYNGLKWVGASPVVVIPLPLFLPAGKERINFGMLGDDVVSVKHETVIRSFVYLPMIIDNDIIVGTYHSTAGPYDCKFISKPPATKG